MCRFIKFKIIIKDMRTYLNESIKKVIDKKTVSKNALIRNVGPRANVISNLNHLIKEKVLYSN
jgi:hypothetical protein